MNRPSLFKQTLSNSTGIEKASRLLEGLESMRGELGPLAEELISLLRRSGVKPTASQQDTTPTDSKH